MNDKISDDMPEIIKSFLGYLGVVKGRSRKTVDEYYNDLRTFFRYIKIKRGLASKDTDFKDIKICDVDAELIRSISLTDVFEYMNYLSFERKNEAASRSRKSCSLRTFFNYLKNKSEQIDENPLTRLETPKLKKSLPKFLTLDQSMHLLETVRKNGGEYKERDYCMVTLFLNCGMRLSELSNINLADIKSDRSLKLTGKGNKERFIYLNDACKHAIDSYIKVRPKIPGCKDALFISRNKNRMSIKTVQYTIKKYLSMSGLDGMGYSVHKLRHTAATLMYQHGNVDIRVLKDILGHENLGTTEIYTHLANIQIKKALDANPLSNATAKVK